MIPPFWLAGMVLAIVAAYRIFWAAKLIDSVIEWE